MRHRRASGFTIVELLIVIVVIAILATITIVAFNGIQARANDAKMRAAADQLEKAIQLWNTKSGQLPRGGWSSTVALSGGNCSDGTGGWAASGSYACTFEDILFAEQLIPDNYIDNLPPNKSYGTATNGRLSMMFYPCGSTGRYALYYHLLSPTAEDTASLTSAEAGGCPTTPRTTYGMKAASVMSFG